MTEIVAPPLVDGVIVALLEAQCGVPAATKVPAETRPDTFIRVLLVGGAGRSSVAVHRALVVVECWALSAADAEQLAAHVDGVMYAAPYLASEIRAVTSSSSINYFPDADSRHERYTATYNVTARASVLP